MSVIVLLVLLALLAFFGWLINSKMPGSATVKLIMNVVIIVLAVVLVLYAFGIWEEVKSIPVPKVAMLAQIGTNGLPDPGPIEVSASRSSWWLGLIPFVVPVIVGLVKGVIPKIPSLYLGPLAIVLGTLLETLAYYGANIGTGNPELGAALGLASSGAYSLKATLMAHIDAKRRGLPVPSPETKAALPPSTTAPPEAKTVVTEVGPVPLAVKDSPRGPTISR